MTAQQMLIQRPPNVDSHTLGDWRAQRVVDLCGIVIYSQRYGPSDLIAVVEGTFPECEANARLIRAAPKMMALLMGVRRTPNIPVSQALADLIDDVLAEIKTPLPQSGAYPIVA